MHAGFIAVISWRETGTADYRWTEWSGQDDVRQYFRPEYSQIKEFVNADLIARGISPFNPKEAEFEAGRLSIIRSQQFLEEQRSFAWETTLTGQRWHRVIHEAKSRGFIVKAYYIHLDSIELTIQRIRDRVAKGGHDIPIDVVMRRYELSNRNFFRFCVSLIDEWQLFDNSKSEYQLVALGSTTELNVVESELYRDIISKYGNG